jgi:transcriptional regulator NrdR family protein
MKCPLCSTWARTLETRAKPGNVTYRRYECANLHRFTTTETVLRADAEKRRYTIPRKDA